MESEGLRVHLWMVSSGCLDAAPVFSVAGVFFGTILQKSGTPLLWDLKDYGYVNQQQKYSLLSCVYPLNLWVEAEGDKMLSGPL